MKVILSTKDTGCSQDITIFFDRINWVGFRYQIDYTVYLGDDNLFSGDQYWVPDFWENEKIVHSLIAWITTRPGDTDKEYFDNYTPEQLAWCESSDCEQLICWWLDQELNQA